MILIYLIVSRVGDTAGSLVRRVRRGWPGGHAGQTTAEYGLVLLAAAAIAMALVAWATHSNAITTLFDRIVKKLIDQT
jgi:Flp pilus assembly pilin Flp